MIPRNKTIYEEADGYSKILEESVEQIRTCTHNANICIWVSYVICAISAILQINKLMTLSILISIGVVVLCIDITIFVIYQKKIKQIIVLSDANLDKLITLLDWSKIRQRFLYKPIDELLMRTIKDYIICKEDFRFWKTKAILHCLLHNICLFLVGYLSL